MMMHWLSLVPPPLVYMVDLLVDGPCFNHQRLVMDMIEHQQVIADRVIAIDVAAGEQPAGVRDRGSLLVENPIAQFLRLADFGYRFYMTAEERQNPLAALRAKFCAATPAQGR